ncbi:G-protein coupled receptor [Dirofilaria immitis]
MVISNASAEGEETRNVLSFSAVCPFSSALTHPTDSSRQICSMLLFKLPSNVACKESDNKQPTRIIVLRDDKS